MSSACAAAFAPANFAGAQGDELPLDAAVLKAVHRKFAGFSGQLTILAPQGSEANINPVINEFSEKTGVVVNLKVVPPDEVNTELVLDSVLGSAEYDVALPATFALPDLVSANALAPLDHLADRYEPQGFRKDIMYRVGDTVDDQLFGFQTDGDAYVMFYHKEMLTDPEAQKRYADAYGAPLDIPQTWPELDRQMAFFHAPNEGRFGGVLFRTPAYLVWEWWVRFHAKGIWPFSPDMIPQIQSEQGVDALVEMIKASEHQVNDVDTMGLFDNWRRFSQGDIFANIGWGGTQKYPNSPNSKMQGRMVFGPTPGGIVNAKPLEVPYFNWGWNYVVSASSQQIELAYLFSLFASSPRLSTISVGQRDGFFDRFRPEHYDDPRIIQAYSAPFLKVHRRALRNAIPDLYLRGQSDYMHALAEGLDAALQGHLSPEIALQRITLKWELITSRVGRSDQILRWRRLRQKYPVKVSDLLRDV